jgi:hypothetical protein
VPQACRVRGASASRGVNSETNSESKAPGHPDEIDREGPELLRFQAARWQAKA